MSFDLKEQVDGVRGREKQEKKQRKRWRKVERIGEEKRQKDEEGATYVTRDRLR